MDTRVPPVEQLLDVIPCGLVSFDANALVLYCNQAFRDFIGYADHEITGQKIEKLLTMPGRVFFQTHLLPLLRLQTTVEEVYVNFKAKNGQSLPMLLNGRRVGDGEQLIIHCSCFPLNHRIRYEEQLLADKRSAEALSHSDKEAQYKQQLEQQKTEYDLRLRELKSLQQELLQFQKLISHDIAEQTRKLEIFIGLLLKTLENSFTPVQKKYHEVIENSIVKVNRLFDYFSQFIALTSKNEKQTVIDLSLIIRQAFTAVSSQYPDIEATLSVEEIAPVRAFLKQIESLFEYLLDNSFKFARQQVAPQIRITMSILPYNSLADTPGEYRYKDYLQILYTDNSRGFDEKYREEVFTLMNRITGESIGGLGLAFCKKIVNNHHGFISITSPLNDGVQVKIYLPV